MIEKRQGLFKAQLNLFYLALSFFTRLPVPKSMHYSASLLNQANRYFSLVGLVLGGILVLTYFCLQQFLPIHVSILLVMSLSLLLTGAFHEDGLADMADGMGGGFTQEKKLDIMKDSRIGTYGAVTLVMALLIKFTLLTELAQIDMSYLLFAILLAESLSRAVAGSLITSLPYVTENEVSKSKPLAQNQSPVELFILMAIGALPLCFFSFDIFIALVVVLTLFRWLFSKWLMQHIGGFTGDCLGAAQQIAQLLIYVVLLAFTYNVSILGGTL